MSTNVLPIYRLSMPGERDQFATSIHEHLTIMRANGRTGLYVTHSLIREGESVTDEWLVWHTGNPDPVGTIVISSAQEHADAVVKGAADAREYNRAMDKSIERMLGDLNRRAKNALKVHPMDECPTQPPMRKSTRKAEPFNSLEGWARIIVKS